MKQQTNSKKKGNPTVDRHTWHANKESSRSFRTSSHWPKRSYKSQSFYCKEMWTTFIDSTIELYACLWLLASDKHREKKSCKMVCSSTPGPRQTDHPRHQGNAFSDLNSRVQRAVNMGTTNLLGQTRSLDKKNEKRIKNEKKKKTEKWVDLEVRKTTSIHFFWKCQLSMIWCVIWCVTFYIYKENEWSRRK